MGLCLVFVSVMWILFNHNVIGYRGKWSHRFGDLSEYFLSRSVKRYNISRQICRRMGGEMAFIKSEEDQEFLQSEYSVQTGFPDQYFIGLRRDSNGDFFWNNGEALNYTNWRSGEPASNNSNTCVTMQSSYAGFKWVAERCDSARGFTCRRLIRHRGVWLRNGSIEYYISPESVSLSYNDSRERCQSDGGDLAEMNWAELIDFRIFLGLNKTGEPYHFFMDTIFPRSFSANDTTPEKYCTDLAATETNIVAEIFNCSAPGGFICQRRVAYPHPAEANDSMTMTPISSFTLHLPSFLIGTGIAVPFLFALIIMLCRGKLRNKTRNDKGNAGSAVIEYDDGAYEEVEQDFESRHFRQHQQSSWNHGFTNASRSDTTGFAMGSRPYTGYEQPISSTTSSREEVEAAYEGFQFG